MAGSLNAHIEEAVGNAAGKLRGEVRAGYIHRSGNHGHSGGR